MIATFFQVFPNGAIFSNDEHYEGYDAVLMGQAEPSKIDVDNLQGLLDRSEYFAVKESLAEVGFGNGGAGQQYMDRGPVLELFATFAGQASDLQEWTKNAQINHDRDLRLQYLAGMYFNSYLSTKILQSILSHYKFPANLFAGSEDRLGMLKQALMESGRR